MVVKARNHDVDRLLEIPEINAAMDRYEEIQAEFCSMQFVPPPVTNCPMSKRSKPNSPPYSRHNATKS